MEQSVGRQLRKLFQCHLVNGFNPTLSMKKVKSVHSLDSLFLFNVFGDRRFTDVPMTEVDVCSS
jgi:hypothetical protein